MDVDCFHVAGTGKHHKNEYPATYTLFFLQMIPIPLPRLFFDRLSSILSEFVWYARKPRIALRVLKRLKYEGGLGIPDI